MRAQTCLISLAIILAIAPHVSAQNTPNASQAMAELRAVHDAWNAGVESGDVKRAHSFFTNDFVIKAGNKILSLTEIEQISQFTKQPEVIERKHTTVIQKLKFDGPDAILTTEHTEYETHKLTDGSVRRLTSEKQQQERWVRQGSDWKLAVIQDIKPKHSEVTVNGRKVDNFVAELATPVQPNANDKPVLDKGFGLIFVYRLNDGAVIKAPVYVNDAKVAHMTGGSFLKIKLQPGKYFLKSDKGDPIEVVVEAGNIQFLALKLDTGFPKGRGVLRLDTSILGAEGYKFPRLLDLTPLGADNIDDPSKVITGQ